MTSKPATRSTSDRLWQVDALRGLMLVLMAATHLPTRFSSPLGQPFGFVSAAEGFVLLSGFMAGMVYTKRQRRSGDVEMRTAFLRRVLKIYVCQAALLVFLFSVITFIGVAAEQVAVTNMMNFYLQQPLVALAGGLLLVYNPPLLDILPMYILFMLFSPLLLVFALRRGWAAILALSVALWLGSQFGLGSALYSGAVKLTGLPVPFRETGAFEILAWQFLWVMGLWLGWQRAMADNPGNSAGSHSAHGNDSAASLAFPHWMVRTAIVIGIVGLVWRHAVGQVPFPDMPSLNLLFDKWQLAPLRLINLFALLVLTVHFAPWMSAKLPRIRMLEILGSASLPVFCAHLVLALLALAAFGEQGAERSWAIDIGIFVVSYAVLCGVALISRQLDRQAAQLKARVQAQAKTRMAKLTAKRTAWRAAARNLPGVRK